MDNALLAQLKDTLDFKEDGESIYGAYDGFGFVFCQRDEKYLDMRMWLRKSPLAKSTPEKFLFAKGAFQTSTNDTELCALIPVQGAEEICTLLADLTEFLKQNYYGNVCKLCRSSIGLDFKKGENGEIKQYCRLCAQKVKSAPAAVSPEPQQTTAYNDTENAVQDIPIFNPQAQSDSTDDSFTGEVTQTQIDIKGLASVYQDVLFKKDAASAMPDSNETHESVKKQSAPPFAVQKAEREFYDPRFDEDSSTSERLPFDYVPPTDESLPRVESINRSSESKNTTPTGYSDWDDKAHGERFKPMKPYRPTRLAEKPMPIKGFLGSLALGVACGVLCGLIYHFDIIVLWIIMLVVSVIAVIYGYLLFGKKFSLSGILLGFAAVFIQGLARVLTTRLIYAIKYPSNPVSFTSGLFSDPIHYLQLLFYAIAIEKYAVGVIKELINFKKEPPQNSNPIRKAIRKILIGKDDEIKWK